MKDNKAIILTYLGDMAATESGLSIALNRHIDDDNTKPYENVRTLFRKIASSADAHHLRLEQAISSRGGSASSPVKETATSLLGVAHGLVDKLREHTVSKMVRDTHTELNLAAIALSMLHTTALGLGDHEVAQLAHEQLKKYTGFIMAVGHLAPEVVLRDLKTDGYIVDMSVLGRAQADYSDAWQNPASATTA